MKQWMQQNRAKFFVRAVLIIVAGVILIPHMKNAIEAHATEQATSSPTYTDSIFAKGGIEDWNPRVVDSNGTRMVVVDSFVAVTATGDTLTQDNVDEVRLVLDYHTQPLKVVLLCRTYTDGRQVSIGVVHIPYDVYQVFTK